MVKPVKLLQDETVTFEPIVFQSPAPLENTFDTSLIQAQMAADHSKTTKPDLNLGTGSQLFVFTSVYTDRQHFSSNGPATGLTLRDNNDKILLDFEQASVSGNDNANKPWAACAFNITPGIYSLCLETATGCIYKQTIVASTGWQTQVFLQPLNYGMEGNDDSRADLVNSALFMSRIGEGFNPGSMALPIDKDFRLTEQIRQALINRKNVIGTDMLGSLFSGKFDNPMLGIYAAHLLLLNKDFVYSELKTLINNLRTLLGSNHPDVEAIALKIGMTSDHVFKTFPMLARSWAFVLEASAINPSIIPVDSIAYENAGEFWNADLWLIWGKENCNGNEYIVKGVVASIQVQLQISLKTSGLAPAFNLIKDKLRVALKLLGHDRVRDVVLAYLNRDRLLAISQALGIPGSKIEDILNHLNVNKLIGILEQLTAAPQAEVQNEPQIAKWQAGPEANSRKLSAIVSETDINGMYKVILTVESTNAISPLTGEVKFHLPGIYLNPNPVIAVKAGKAVLELKCVLGSFTVGAEADEGNTRLELDLAQLPGVPQQFIDG